MPKTSADKRVAVVVAAGSGTRAGGGVPKQFREVCGKMLLQHTLDGLAACGLDGIVVVHPNGAAEVGGLDTSGFAESALVPGGSSRSGSVRAGLKEAETMGCKRVFVHDGARPLVVRDVVDRLDAALDKADGAVPALPVIDALKQVDSGRVGSDVERGSVVRVQTPQAFRFDAIVSAYARVDGDYSDSSAVLVATGGRVLTVEGDERMFKVTTPEDFARLEAIL